MHSCSAGSCRVVVQDPADRGGSGSAPDVHRSGIGFSGIHLHTVYRDETSDDGTES